MFGPGCGPWIYRPAGYVAAVCFKGNLLKMHCSTWLEHKTHVQRRYCRRRRWGNRLHVGHVCCARVRRRYTRTTLARANCLRFQTSVAGSARAYTYAACEPNRVRAGAQAHKSHQHICAGTLRVCVRGGAPLAFAHDKSHVI